MSENITTGRVKTRVLPDPVDAMPMMSLPDSTVGSPCICEWFQLSETIIKNSLIN